MRFPTTFAIAFAFASFPAYSQFGVSASSNGTGATITISAPATMAMQPITGAPYSGALSSESVQTLPDGTHLTRAGMMTTTTYRDSLGRVRTERPLFSQRPGAAQSPAFTLIEIQDPIAGYRYLLDSLNHVAHRMPLQVRPASATSAPAGAAAVSSRTLPDGTAITSEPLGTKTMFGVTVTGTRTTMTYPPGSTMGNDRTVTSTSENWISQQLRIMVYSRSESPGGNENTTTLKNLSTAEPESSLFLIPPGYQVVDETGSFTIKIGSPN